MTAGQRIKRVVISVGLLIGLTGVFSGGLYEYLHLTGNVGVVEQGVCYRSGQLDASQLNQIIVKDGIRSILNLRGASPNAGWYNSELSVSASRHVVHYDYPLSANRFVTPAQDEEILHIIENAPKPILIHCQAGSDRTGLVSALYRYTHGATLETSRNELSLRYGHFPYLWSETDAMDKSFSAYVQMSAKK